MIAAARGEEKTSRGLVLAERCRVAEFVKIPALVEGQLNSHEFSYENFGLGTARSPFPTGVGVGRAAGPSRRGQREPTSMAPAQRKTGPHR